MTTLLGRAPRIKKSGQILAELDAIKGTGWRGDVFFVDDNLIGNRQGAEGGSAAGADRLAEDVMGR